MSSKRRRVLAVAVVAATVLVAGQSAYTNGNSLPGTTLGYGSTEITGVTASSIVYSTNAQGTEITDAAIMLTGNYSTGYIIKAGFGSDPLTLCSVTGYDGTKTAVACTGYTQPTGSALSFRVLVTNG